jgi:hypothetical protein
MAIGYRVKLPGEDPDVTLGVHIFYRRAKHAKVEAQSCKLPHLKYLDCGSIFIVLACQGPTAIGLLTASSARG